MTSPTIHFRKGPYFLDIMKWLLDYASESKLQKSLKTVDPRIGITVYNSTFESSRQALSSLTLIALVLQDFYWRIESFFCLIETFIVKGEQEGTFETHPWKAWFNSFYFAFFMRIVEAAIYFTNYRKLGTPFNASSFYKTEKWFRQSLLVCDKSLPRFSSSISLFCLY